MTIRRDVERLEQTGSLRRHLGKVLKGASSSFEPPFPLRIETNSSEKIAIAQEISRQIDDLETIILDGGSTGIAIAKELQNRNLTVCTPSLRVAEVLKNFQGIRLIVTGGFVRRGEESLIGMPAISTLRELRFDTYVMTASGVTPSQGCTEWNVDDAAVKKVALEVSQRTILAADSSKFQKMAFAKVCDLSSINLVITDTNLDANTKTEIEKICPAVFVATPGL
jgi:DeoR/GlpR family transcriptional regulator of sugar metabolism